MMYRRKPTVVDAEQFTGHGSVRGVHYSESLGHYVTTMQGRHVSVSYGEWIVAEPDGTHYYPIADAEFRRIYEPADNT